MDFIEMYRGRRQKLMETIKEGVAYIRPAMHTNDPSSIDHNLKYLTGIEDRNAVLLMAPNGIQIMQDETLRTEQVRRGFRVKEVLFIRAQTEREIIISGKKPTLDELREQTGIEAVLDLSLLDKVLGNELMFTDTLWVNVPQRLPVTTSLTDDIIFLNALKERFIWVNFKNLGLIIHEMRRVKDAYEIECIREAFEAHTHGYEQIMMGLKPGDNECKGKAIWDYELGLLPSYISAEDAMKGEDANIIVAAGKNATIAHYEENTAQIEDNDLVLIDSGVACKGYCSDITRTFPVNGKFTPRQREIYAIALEAQKAAIATMKPGGSNFIAHRAVYDVWKKYGLEQYGYGSCGHPVGMNIHDQNGVFMDDDKPYVPGVTLVIEPYISIPEEGIAVRIEDGVLITEDGCEMFAGPAREIEDVERLCQTECVHTNR